MGNGQRSTTRFVPAMFLLLALLPVSAAGADEFPALRARRFVVAESIVLKDSAGQDIVLNPGLLPLPSGTELRSDSPRLGEPPRGPVTIGFRIGSGGRRGILDLNFANARRVLFWLDRPVAVDPESGVPLDPITVRAGRATSGQGIGLRLSVNPDPNAKDSVMLLVLENDRRAVADVELSRGGDHGDPR